MRLNRIILFLTGVFFILNQIPFSAQGFSAEDLPTASQGVLLNNAAFEIPREFGTVEESHRGVSDKTVIYIQDAHDSLEAQENIANIIHYLVAEYGVKIVYEEGYEGPVPTDKYFGGVQDAKLRERVAYFFMDKLRIGGAEYAHITRTKNFQLIGADSLKLHKENITKYQESFKYRKEIDRDLAEMGSAIRKLAQRYFAKNLKEWMGLKERFDRHEIELLDYLLGIRALFFKRTSSQGFDTQYPNISRLLSADQTKNEKLLGKLKVEIKYAALFEEINRLEDDCAQAHMKEARDREIFHNYKLIRLLTRLNAIEVTAEEYEAVKASLKEMDTAKIARFLVSQSHKSVVLSKTWESHIQSAVQFYEVSGERDQSIRSRLEEYGKSDRKEPVVLVYGGFHKENIKKLLNDGGFSYSIMGPKIASMSAKHQDYYKQLMRMGYDKIALPTLVAKATRAPVLLAFPDLMLTRLINRVTTIARNIPSGDRAAALREMDRKYAQINSGNSVQWMANHLKQKRIKRIKSAAASARSEVRMNKILKAVSAKDFKQLIRDAYFLGKIKSVSRVPDFTHLPEAEDKVEISTTMVLRKISGQWRFLMGARPLSSDRAGLYIFPAGKRDKAPSVDYETDAEIQALLARGLLFQKDVLPGVESPAGAAVRELFEETGIKKSVSDIDLRLPDLLQEIEGTSYLIHRFLVVDEADNDQVQNSSELDTLRWPFLRHLFRKTPGEKIERWLQGKITGASIMDHLKETGFPGFRDALARALSARSEMKNEAEFSEKEWEERLQDPAFNWTVQTTVKLKSFLQEHSDNHGVIYKILSAFIEGDQLALDQFEEIFRRFDHVAGTHLYQDVTDSFKLAGHAVPTSWHQIRSRYPRVIERLRTADRNDVELQPRARYQLQRLAVDTGDELYDHILSVVVEFVAGRPEVLSQTDLIQDSLVPVVRRRFQRMLLRNQLNHFLSETRNEEVVGFIDPTLMIRERIHQVKNSWRSTKDEFPFRKVEFEVAGDERRVPNILAWTEEAMFLISFDELLKNAAAALPRSQQSPFLRQGKVRVEIKIDQRLTQFIISNDGGMPQDFDAAKAFVPHLSAAMDHSEELFLAGSANDSFTLSGGGVGLFIAKTIAEIHGGHLEYDAARSSDDTGKPMTTFKLTYPTPAARSEVRRAMRAEEISLDQVLRKAGPTHIYADLASRFKNRLDARQFVSELVRLRRAGAEVFFYNSDIAESGSLLQQGVNSFQGGTFHRRGGSFADILRKQPQHKSVNLLHYSRSKPQVVTRTDSEIADTEDFVYYVVGQSGSAVYSLVEIAAIKLKETLPDRGIEYRDGVHWISERMSSWMQTILKFQTLVEFAKAA